LFDFFKDATGPGLFLAGDAVSFCWLFFLRDEGNCCLVFLLGDVDSWGSSSGEFSLSAETTVLPVL